MVFEYTWFPLEYARSLEPNAPKKLRDLIWPGARITADDGTSADVFLFALYPGSSEHEDDLVKLGRMTVTSPRTCRRASVSARSSSTART